MGDRPHASITDWDFSQSHADNIWLSSRLRVFDFLWFTVENALSHTWAYVLPTSEQKRSAKSFSFGYS